MKTKEFLVPKEGNNCIFLFAHGSAKLARKESGDSSAKLAVKGSEIRTSDPIRQDSEEEEELRSDLRGATDKPDSANQQQERDELEANLFSGEDLKASFIPMSCHRKARSNSSKVHWRCPADTQDWTCSKGVRLMIIEMLTATGDCQGNGLTSLSSPRGYTWSTRRLTKIKTTSRPKNIRPEISSGMSTKPQQNKKKRGTRKAKARQCAKIGRCLGCRPGRQRIQWNLETCA